ncbi:AAA family ATPase [Leptolyngbya ohadii]|uniref:AAA family ATPase n=1 Tax=Leptolyngbya ohadii TaxID=1962290 RepID=UPI000B59F872|nr:AAA family ATPase [Leptolyngbya ohadii]
MRIELAGWSSEGLRCPDVEIDLRTGDRIAPVSLIQMPNGTGKTTTLTMIRAAMTGKAHEWSSDKIRGLRRPGESHSEGKFILHLRVDDQPLTFELTLNFDTGKAEYRTTSVGSGGIKPGWEPPPQVKRFLDSRFVQLFVFDGEFADKLLDSSESEASKAIDALFQLYLLQDIHKIAEDAWEKATKNKTAKAEKGLSQRRKKVEALKARIAQVKEARDKASAELDLLKPELDILEQKISEQIGAEQSLREEFDTKKEEARDARNQVELAASEVMTRMRQPHLLHEAFAQSLNKLKLQLDRLRLPASTSSQFFNELLEENECICGRPLDHHSREVIGKRRELYLAEDTSGILNALKQDIDVQVRQGGNETAADLTQKLEQLEEAVTANKLADTAVRALEQELIDQGDDELRAWTEERDRKIKRKQELENFLRDTNRAASSSDDEKTFCLASLKKQLKEAGDDLAEITGTLELRAKTDVLQTIAEQALKKAQANLRVAIAEECNQRLEKVLSRDPIRIEKIDRSLNLLNQEGASVGQTLSVGYTFLTTLLSRGQHQFPLIVDSPANPLSMEVRREIAKLIPSLCKQFVAFTISSERAGFTDVIHTSSGNTTKFLTVFRKTPGTEALVRSLPKTGVQKTPNAVLVEGKEYFDHFDLNEAEG